MVMNAIKSRKSVRKYSDKAIADDLLLNILEAGRLAPSWCNSQPWKFIVVKSQETKNILAEASGGQQQVKNAQVVICCVADLSSWNNTNFGKVLAQKGLDEPSIKAFLSSKILNPTNLGEYEVILRSIEQLTYPVAYMTLEAQELGIGACVVGALANELTKKDEGLMQKVKQVLNLREDQILVDLLTLGYEESVTPAKKLRKKISDVIFYETLDSSF